MHNRIRIARGNVSAAPNDIKAEKGVPFYDTTNKRLYIGKDNTTPINQYTKNESPIAFEADNVSKTINGNNIADIFEPGTTLGSTTVVVKNTTNADNAILNSDGSYSGFTKDVSNKIIKTTDNLIISCKYLVAHSDSFTNELNLSESWVDNATYELKYMINGSIRFIKFIYNPTDCPGVTVDQSFYVATSSGKKGFILYTYEVDWSSNPNKLSVFSFSNCTEVLVPDTGSGTATGSQQNFTNNILLALYRIIE